MGKVEPAQTGQVWEGADGWVVMILESDPAPLDEWFLHRIYTLAYPDGYTESVSTVAEHVGKGGMARAGWRRIA